MFEFLQAVNYQSRLDTVARQEIVSKLDSRISLNQALNKGTDIRYQGEEIIYWGQYWQSRANI